MPWCVLHNSGCSLVGREEAALRVGRNLRSGDGVNGVVCGVEQSLADGTDLPQAGRNSIPLVCKRCGVTVARKSTTTIREEKDVALSSPMAGERGLTVARESTT